MFHTVLDERLFSDRSEQLSVPSKGWESLTRQKRVEINVKGSNQVLLNRHSYIPKISWITETSQGS